MACEHIAQVMSLQNAPERLAECFVIMPFGIKVLRDGSARTYDFEKVYRIIIQRAVRQAGMIPVRADERIGSAIIHTVMFKDLRDQGVVLADLSLENPNVFYELGIRHVMSPSGTVLICRKGSELPFDVKLSRVVFYDYDGRSLDWEEAERVVQELQAALQEARRGSPDSPVHALLESVLRPSDASISGGASLAAVDLIEQDALIAYEDMVAQTWIDKGYPLSDLKANKESIFGARCLGQYCLNHPAGLPEDAESIAAHLSDQEQYRLANQIFKRLRDENKLPPVGLLQYASSYSEAHSNTEGANHAIALAEEAIAKVKRKHDQREESNEALADYADCYRRLAGLHHWRWQLTGRPEDLATVINTLSTGVQYCEKARAAANFPQPGLIAQAWLKLMLLLRIRDNNAGRVDVEGHRDSICKLIPSEGDDRKGISYLNWFQAIALADAGASDAAKKKALNTLAEDARLNVKADYWEIGRRQYRILRRFLERHSQVLRNQSLIGTIAQYLQTGDQNS